MPELGKATYELIFNTAQVANMARAETEVVAATDAMATGADTAESAVARMAAAVGLAAREMAASMGEAGAAASTFATEVEAASAKAAAASQAGAAKAGNAWLVAGKKMSSIGKSMTHKITLPVAVVAGVGVKMFLDYSQKIRLLGTQAGASATEVEHMRKAVLELSKSSTQGPNELANAMYHIESAGIRGAEALDVLKTASNGAMVGNASLEDTTYALVSAFESQAKGTMTVGDAMANVNAIIGAGDMRLQDLTGALSTGIIPSAKGAGLGIRDIGAALDTMTSRGMPAQQAATRLGMTIAMMQKPTAAATKALNSIGIGQLDLARIMRAKGLAPALDYLVSKLKTVADPAKRAAIVLQAFGGGRSGKAMLLLLQNLGDMKMRFAEVTKNAKNFNQAVKDAKAEPINQLKEAWSAVRVALIQVGAAAAPTLVSLAHGISSIASFFSKLNPKVQKLIVIFFGLLAAVGPVLWIFGKLFLALGRIGAAAKFVWGVRGAMLGLETATAATTATVALAALGWVLFAAAGVAAVYEIVNHIPLIGGALRRVGKWFGGVAADAVGIGSGDKSANAASNSASRGNTGPVYLARQRYAKLKASGLSRDEVLKIMGRDPRFAGYTKDMLDTYTKGDPKNWTSAGAPNAGAPVVRGKNHKAKKDPLFGKLGINDSLGGGAGGSKTEFLPIDMQIALAQAGLTTSTGDDIKVLKGQEGFLRNLLKNHKLSKTKQLAILNELDNVHSQLTSLMTGAAKKAKGGYNGLIPVDMAIAYQKALQTKGKGDDIKQLRAQESYLQGLLKNHKLSASKQLAIMKALTDVKKKLAADLKGQLSRSQALDKEMQAFVDTRGSFFSQFASSVFHQGVGGLEMGAGEATKTLNIHQDNNYHEIPKDRFAQGRQLARAAASSL